MKHSLKKQNIWHFKKIIINEFLTLLQSCSTIIEFLKMYCIWWDLVYLLNNISTPQGLDNAKISFFCKLWLKIFFMFHCITFHFTINYLCNIIMVSNIPSNSNNFQTDIFDPVMRPNRYYHSQSVNLGVMMIKRYHTDFQNWSHITRCSLMPLHYISKLNICAIIKQVKSPH